MLTKRTVKQPRDKEYMIISQKLIVLIVFLLYTYFVQRLHETIFH